MVPSSAYFLTHNRAKVQRPGNGLFNDSGVDQLAGNAMVLHKANEEVEFGSF